MIQYIYQCNLKQKKLCFSWTRYFYHLAHTKQSETQYIHEDEHKLYEIQEETKPLENKERLTLYESGWWDLIRRARKKLSGAPNPKHEKYPNDLPMQPKIIWNNKSNVSLHHYFGDIASPWQTPPKKSLDFYYKWKELEWLPTIHGGQRTTNQETLRFTKKWTQSKKKANGLTRKERVSWPENLLRWHRWLHRYLHPTSRPWGGGRHKWVKQIYIHDCGCHLSFCLCQ